MTWFDGVPATGFSIGPPADYAVALNNGTAQTQLLVGATGNFYLPQIPGGFLQQGKPGQAVFLHLSGTMTSANNPGTVTINIGLNATAATAGGTAIPASTSIYQSKPLILTSTTAGLSWEVDLKAYTRAVGYGTSAVSTSMQSTGIFSWSTAQQCGNDITQPVTTIDASVTQYFWATANFQNSSASNIIKCNLAIAYGMS